MSWNPKYVVLILLTTVVSYSTGILIEKSNSAKGKKIYLSIAGVICLGILFFFKYFNFFSESIADVLGYFAINLQPLTLRLLLPVGISFYTFQTLGYVIDVYRGKVPAEHHFGYYATFVSFFPQIMAGPIGRADKLLPQIKAEHSFEYDCASYGIKQMAWGFFKKMMIADIIAVYVDKVFDNPVGYTGFTFILAAVLFTIQIYCDFSGYSDIATGCARLMGIELMTNFKSPYFSSSVREFWSRWHISLSTWFRDYVYIPLGGNRVSFIRHKVNLMVTFLVSGLWHGANWTFVVWGGVHGLMQVVEACSDVFFGRKREKSVPQPDRRNTGTRLRIIIVFAFCSFAWIFFRAGRLKDAIYIIGHSFSGITSPVEYIRGGISSLGMARRARPLIMISLVVLTVFDYFDYKSDVIKAIGCMKPIVKWPIYILFLALAFQIYSMIGVSGASFVYFRF